MTIPREVRDALALAAPAERFECSVSTLWRWMNAGRVYGDASTSFGDGAMLYGVPIRLRMYLIGWRFVSVSGAEAQSVDFDESMSLRFEAYKAKVVNDG